MMSASFTRGACFTPLLLAFFAHGSGARGDDGIKLVRAPGGGIQPQVARDASGGVHLVCFRGRPEAGDLYYTGWDTRGANFTPSIRVNHSDSSAIAIGTIRGPRIAVGKQGSVHVAWNGSNQAPRNRFGGNAYFHARLTPGSHQFEPEQNLMQVSSALDGGGAVAADQEGRVFTVWHAQLEDSTGERNRRVFVAQSSDSGSHWSVEKLAWDRSTGACGCCSLQAAADREGVLFILYRTAQNEVERGMQALISTDHAGRFQGRRLDSWRIASCPMSSASIAESSQGVFAAWERDGQVFFQCLKPAPDPGATPFHPSGQPGSRKHPALAIAKSGAITLVWAEGTGWQRGGDLAWQRFDQAGKPLGQPTIVPGGIPTWSLPAAAPLPNSQTLIVH